MPTEFQKLKYQTLDGLPNTYTFIDDILIATKDMQTKHWGQFKRF